MRQVVGFVNRSMGRGSFGGEFGACHCNQRGLYGVSVRQCASRRSCGFGWCLQWAEALLYYMGSTSCKGKGTFCGFCSPFSQSEIQLDH